MNVSPEDIERISRLVDELAGIQWGADKAYLMESRLPALLKQFNIPDLQDLASRLRSGTDKALRTAFIDTVTTRETLFFRDESPFDALRHKALPELIDAKANTPYANRLRFWSAACSSGQEPYSLAMVLTELIDDIDDWDVKIYATDLAPAAIETASKGFYSDFEMQRGMPVTFRDKYFRRAEGGWRVVDEIRSLVSFEQRNLLQPFKGIGPFDVIFCRNVAIYFEEQAKRDLFERLAGALAPHGTIFIGASESLSNMGPKWKPLHHCRGVFYQPNRADLGPIASVCPIGNPDGASKPKATARPIAAPISDESAAAARRANRAATIAANTASTNRASRSASFGSATTRPATVPAASTSLVRPQPSPSLAAGSHVPLNAVSVKKSVESHRTVSGAASTVRTATTPAVSASTSVANARTSTNLTTTSQLPATSNRAVASPRPAAAAPAAASVRTANHSSAAPTAGPTSSTATSRNTPPLRTSGVASTPVASNVSMTRAIAAPPVVRPAVKPTSVASTSLGQKSAATGASTLASSRQHATPSIQASATRTAATSSCPAVPPPLSAQRMSESTAPRAPLSSKSASTATLAANSRLR